jgi:transcriptional antiterminator NusG
MSAWHILHVKAHEEDKVAELLNTHPDIQAFVPRRIRLVKRKGNLIREQHILFSNYVFIKTDLGVDAFYTFIQKYISQLSTYIKVLKYQDRTVSTLSDQEIHFLSRFLDDQHIIQSSEGFIVDTQVVITEGPLKGFEGIIKHINRHKQCARISMTFFGEDHEFEVGLNIVMKM